MSIIHVAPELCNPNKFQPETRRTFTPDQLADLASIADIGFIHTPIGYKENGTYMIIVGWRRRCAWQQFRPSEPMPLDLRDQPATDAELYRMTVTENEARENFNPIQRADLAAKAIELGMTQVEAGKLFNPPLSQSAVSHLLSLRKLPDEIKVHIASGAIPERIARQLVTPAKHARDKTIQAAQKIADAKESEKDSVCSNALFDLYMSVGICLDRPWVTPWVHIGSNAKVVGLDWPKDPIHIPDAKSDKGDPSEIPACTDCPFNVQYRDLKYCMRPACHHLKQKLWHEQHEAKQTKASAKATPAKATPKATQEANKREAEARAKQQAKHEADKAKSLKLLRAAAAIVAAKLPAIVEPYASILYDRLLDGTTLDEDEAPELINDKKSIALLKPADKQQHIALMLLADDLWRWGNATPNEIRKGIEKLAVEWKVNLPRDWAANVDVSPKKKIR